MSSYIYAQAYALDMTMDLVENFHRFKKNVPKKGK